MTAPFVADTAAIAAVRADESRQPAARRLFDDPYARLFVEVLAPTEIRARCSTSPSFASRSVSGRVIDDFLELVALEGALPPGGCRRSSTPNTAHLDKRGAARQRPEWTEGIERPLSGFGRGEESPDSEGRDGR